MTEFEKRTPDWLSARNALERVLSRAHPLGVERIPLEESLGRALAEGVRAKASLPPWDNSAMDGYAVRGDDVGEASRRSPVTLSVIGESRAGQGDSGRILGSGQAIRIMTGAPVPQGADSVIRVEDTDAEVQPGRVKIFAHGDVGRHVRPGGQDMKEGEEILPPHSTIGPGQLGLLYASGQESVLVHRKPRIALISNGDELAAPGEFHRVLAGEAIPETNSQTLAAEVAMARGIPVPLGIARDNEKDILAKVGKAREEGADALITSGGASMGERDLFKRVLAKEGFTLDFWRVKIRPGTPLSFGFLEKPGTRPLPVFGLPGNPASSFVTFQIFCRPFLMRLAGHKRIHRPVLPAVAGEDFKSPSHLTHFFRVILDGDPAAPEVRLTGSQTSGLIQSQGLAHGLAVVPEGVGMVARGDLLRVILLDDMGLGGTEAGYLPG